MLNALVDIWHPRVPAMVDSLSQRFQREFAKLDLVGEVHLADEIGKWDGFGIKLAVVFRAGESLSTLSTSRHLGAGGEKSVATMVYLNCLQGIPPAAVRVLDEINQGMDAVNERAIFNGMVQAGSDPRHPQCFIVTPKLLPGLVYGPHMRVLAIHNGPKGLGKASCRRSSPDRVNCMPLQSGG